MRSGIISGFPMRTWRIFTAIEGSPCLLKHKGAPWRPLASKVRNQTAFCTLPERRQRVQTLILLTWPFTMARTCFRFGRKRRRVTLCAWLTLFPAMGPFPQISQRLAMTDTSKSGRTLGDRWLQDKKKIRHLMLLLASSVENDYRSQHEKASDPAT